MKISERKKKRKEEAAIDVFGHKQFTPSGPSIYLSLCQQMHRCYDSRGGSVRRLQNGRRQVKCVLRIADYF